MLLKWSVVFVIQSAPEKMSTPMPNGDYHYRYGSSSFQSLKAYRSNDSKKGTGQIIETKRSIDNWCPSVEFSSFKMKTDE